MTYSFINTTTIAHLHTSVLPSDLIDALPHWKNTLKIHSSDCPLISCIYNQYGGPTSAIESEKKGRYLC